MKTWAANFRFDNFSEEIAAAMNAKIKRNTYVGNHAAIYFGIAQTLNPVLRSSSTENIAI